MTRREISQERRAVYYVGMGLVVVGLLSFLSFFATLFLAMGGSGEPGPGMVVRAFLGAGMVAAGRGLMRLGARGVAGSGVLLDPQRARRDLEPWSRMAGGMAKDALDEAGVSVGGRAAAPDMPFDEKLRRLHALHQEGLLSDEEYAREKRELLDSN